MGLNLVVANDIVDAALSFHVRGRAMAQTIQEKPLLAWLRGTKETFPGGKDVITVPLRGQYISNGSDLIQGYSEDDALTFKQSQGIKRASFPWKELHAGLIISETELTKDGITVTDTMKTSDHSKADVTRLTALLKDRLDDFSESYARDMNAMLWGDGTQDPKLIPGLRSILTKTPAVGVTGGIDRAVYPWWRHRCPGAAIQSSAKDQTLSKFLRAEVRQLRRFGGRPNKIFAGTAALIALEEELTEKGIYTQEGFNNEGKNDIGVAQIKMRGVGSFEYDPTMDDIGWSNVITFLDSRRVKLQPIEGEDNKLRTPVRPYNYLVFLKSMTWKGALTANQLNAYGVYEVA